MAWYILLGKISERRFNQLKSFWEKNMDERF